MDRTQGRWRRRRGGWGSPPEVTRSRKVRASNGQARQPVASRHPWGHVLSGCASAGRRSPPPWLPAALFPRRWAPTRPPAGWKAAMKVGAGACDRRAATRGGAGPMTQRFGHRSVAVRALAVGRRCGARCWLIGPIASRTERRRAPKSRRKRGPERRDGATAQAKRAVRSVTESAPAPAPALTVGIGPHGDGNEPAQEGLAVTAPAVVRSPAWPMTARSWAPSMVSNLRSRSTIRSSSGRWVRRSSVARASA
jgi:hypothetical protein